MRFIRKRHEPCLPLPSHRQLVLICRPRRDGRLNRPRCEVAPAEIRTCNLPITSPALYRTATSAPCYIACSPCHETHNAFVRFTAEFASSEHHITYSTVRIDKTKTISVKSNWCVRLTVRELEAASEPYLLTALQWYESSSFSVASYDKSNRNSNQFFATKENSKRNRSTRKHQNILQLYSG